MGKRYEIKDGKAIRKNPFCFRCGAGTMMADHGNFYACGSCGTRTPKNSHRGT